jgi:hypothetical protein
VVTPHPLQLQALQALLAHWGAYHNHKESMAYLATTLYASAAVGAFATRNTVWIEVGSVPRALGTVISAAIVGGFVAWQLKKRNEAADNVEEVVKTFVALGGLSSSLSLVIRRTGLVGPLLAHLAVIVAAMLLIMLP